MRKLIERIAQMAKDFDTAKKIGALLIACTIATTSVVNWAKNVIVEQIVNELKDHSTKVALELFSHNELQRQRQTTNLAALITGVMDRQDRDSLRTAALGAQVTILSQEVSAIRTDLRADTIDHQEERWAALFELLKLQEMDRVNREIDMELQRLYERNRNRVDEIIEGDRAQ